MVLSANVTGAILAGGLGTRLRSVLGDRPKVLAEVAGRPFVTYLLDQYAQAGILETVLCTGWMADHVRETLGDSYAGMKLSYSTEFEPLGTGGALRLALPLFRTRDILIMNGDSCCLADLEAFVAWSQAQRAQAAMLLTRVEDGRRFGRVHTDEGGRILSFHEKSDDAGAAWINAGIYLVGTQLLSAVPGDRTVSLEREVFPTWIGKGFCGYRAAAPFLDIGTPQSYAQGEAFLRHATLLPSGGRGRYSGPGAAAAFWGEPVSEYRPRPPLRNTPHD